jgi:transcriptional regulator with PAS, ATPase and Fis domain
LELTVGALALRSVFTGIVGSSQPLLRALILVERIAPTMTPVLLTGESGTGKEVFAAALHAASPRAHGPFIAVNCGAIPAHLVESELFGHKKGAFTGALRDAPGILRSCEGGTVLLDEIGEMPLEAQAKLLRVLETKRVRPVGADAEVAIDVRVLAATNRDLGKEVDVGRFRQDLHYRLNVVEIHLPALRERASDIPMLVDFFLGQHGRSSKDLSALATRRLLEYRWPGNVRELRNALERAVVLSQGGRIKERHMPPAVASPNARTTKPRTLKQQMRIARRDAMIAALDAHGGNRTQAAKALGVSRQYLVLQIRALAIKPRSGGD